MFRLKVYASALDLIGSTPILQLRSFDRPDAARVYAKLVGTLRGYRVVPGPGIYDEVT